MMLLSKEARNDQTEAEYLTKMLIRKLNDGELKSHTILSTCKRILEIGKETQEIELRDEFLFRASPGGSPFTATLQPNGKYLVTRQGRTVREFSVKELLLRFRHNEWDFVYMGEEY